MRQRGSYETREVSVDVSAARAWRANSKKLKNSFSEFHEEEVKRTNNGGAPSWELVVMVSCLVAAVCIIIGSVAQARLELTSTTSHTKIFGYSFTDPEEGIPVDPPSVAFAGWEALLVPTRSPTKPTGWGSAPQTANPSTRPTETPSSQPTETPTIGDGTVTNLPSATPTNLPTTLPTSTPTEDTGDTITPTGTPTIQTSPTDQPTQEPTTFDTTSEPTTSPSIDIDTGPGSDGNTTLVAEDNYLWTAGFSGVSASSLAAATLNFRLI